ncbi:MAG: TlpA family protein disulfide reductase [Promethearchaeota archaeon]
MPNKKTYNRKKKKGPSKYQKKLDEKRKQQIIQKKKQLEQSLDADRGNSPATIAYIIVISAIILGGVGIGLYLRPNNPPSNNQNGGGTTEGGTSSSYNFDYQVYDIYNNLIQFKNYQGKVLVLNFFEINCPYCSPNMDNLVQAYNELGGSAVVAVVALDVDSRDSVDALKQYKADHSIPYSIAQDYTLNIASKTPFSGGTPTTIIYDKDGNLYKTLMGLQSVDTLKTEIQNAMNA